MQPEIAAQRTSAAQYPQRPSAPSRARGHQSTRIDYPLPGHPTAPEAASPAGFAPYAPAYGLAAAPAVRGRRWPHPPAMRPRARAAVAVATVLGVAAAGLVGWEVGRQGSTAGIGSLGQSADLAAGQPAQRRRRFIRRHFHSVRSATRNPAGRLRVRQRSGSGSTGSHGDLGPVQGRRRHRHGARLPERRGGRHRHGPDVQRRDPDQQPRRRRARRASPSPSLDRQDVQRPTVVGTDPTDDVAVIQLHRRLRPDDGELRRLESTVKVGDAVTGVGNAGGTGHADRRHRARSPRWTSRSPPPTRAGSTPSGSAA